MDTTIQAYYDILESDFPSWMTPYLQVPCIQRLKGIGLFCGTDWTKLYHHKCFYSRYDHSIGVALIIWHFTHDKKQTLAGLLHDVSSPVFSHVVDFKNKDYIKQISTEVLNTTILLEDKQLQQLLKKDNIDFDDISNYHQYPIADNELPRLSADRLEYMFSTGLIMADIWSMERIKACYQNITILQNEEGTLELGFQNQDLAIEYCLKCVEVGKLYVINKNKVALQLLADVIEKSIELKLVTEEDLYSMSEAEVCMIFNQCTDVQFTKYWHTFTNSTSVIESNTLITAGYCTNINVKRRYIDPLCNKQRISSISKQAKEAITSLIEYKTATYGGVMYIE